MQDTLKTPCVQICKINAKTKRCKGCLRTIYQIQYWRRYTDFERDQIMIQLSEERRQIKDPLIIRFE